MYWINEMGSAIVVFAILWIICLFLFINAPVLVCRLLQIQTNFWHVRCIFAIVWVAGTIWFFT